MLTSKARQLARKARNIAIATNIALYSDAIEASSEVRWLFTSAMQGMSAIGELLAGIEAQSHFAWQNIPP
jgi:hypothetical protein